MDAWRAGVNGIYIFNEYSPNKQYLSEIGNPKKLNTIDKRYFASYLEGSVEHFLAGGKKLKTLPRIIPQLPEYVLPGRSLAIPIWIGDDILAAEADGYKPAITTTLWIPNYEESYNPSITINNHAIPNINYKDGYLQFPIKPDYIKRGKNILTFKIENPPENKQIPLTKSWISERHFNDNKLLRWPLNTGYWIYPAPRRNITSAEIYHNNSLHIVDNGTGNNSIISMIHPWTINTNKKTVIEAGIKVNSSSSPDAVALRFTNGRSVEYLTFSENRIGLKFAGITNTMNTTDNFHTYRIEIDKSDIKVFADNKLKLNALGKYTTPITDKKSGINFNAPYYFKPAITNGLSFGSFSGPEKGDALLQFVRHNSYLISIKDFAIDIRYSHTDYQ